MPYINGKYYTDKEVEAIKKKVTEEEFNEFLVSGLIGAITGSALLGGLLGGSFTGGFIGDILEGDDDSWL